MRKIIFIFLFTHCSLLIINAQWQSDVRLTIDSEYSGTTSYNNSRCIAANGNIVHVVWEDYRDGNNEIYYKRSTNGGVSWGVDTRLTNNSASSLYPSISVSGQNVLVVWCDERDGNKEIYCKYSNDGGVNWSTDTRLTNNSASSTLPSLAVYNQALHVVWQDDREGNFMIYYKRSTDGGIDWSADIQLTFNVGGSSSPTVAVTSQFVHVVWNDYRNGYNEIYYKGSTDGGVNWGSDIRLTNDLTGSFTPSISVNGQVVYVVFRSDREGNPEIYYKGSADGGASWGPDIRLTNNSAYSDHPSVTVSGLAVHVVFRDDRDGNPEIYYKCTTDGGVSWETDTRLTNNSANSYFPSVAVFGQIVHVVWCDERDGNMEIYYKRNPTGNSIGIKKISSEIPINFILYQNYPNPFNPVTKIRFSLPYPSEGGAQTVKLVIYDILGREIASLIPPLWGGKEGLQPGTYEVEFDASNLPSSVYFYKLVTEEYSQTKKMILIK